MSYNLCFFFISLSYVVIKPEYAILVCVNLQLPAPVTDPDADLGSDFLCCF